MKRNIEDMLLLILGELTRHHDSELPYTGMCSAIISLACDGTFNPREEQFIRDYLKDHRPEETKTREIITNMIPGYWWSPGDYQSRKLWLTNQIEELTLKT